MREIMLVSQYGMDGDVTRHEGTMPEGDRLTSISASERCPMKLIIRDAAQFPGDETTPPYLIVNATTDELAAPGRVSAQLQLSIANATAEQFPIGRTIKVEVDE